MRFRLSSALWSMFVAFVSPAAAAPGLDYYLPPGTDYAPAVPTPGQYLGWQIGEWHVSSDQVAGYLRAVAAAAPDRVKLEEIGRTHEQKPLLVATVTSAENHGRLEEIRQRHLAAWRQGGGAKEGRDDQPLVVNLGYSVHGNEPSGVNAMMLVVYHLAAARGPAVEEQLRRTVILVEAQRNPDGGDRAASWFNQHKSLTAPSADPADREHNEAWPGGRFNHYWFDANRDWLPLVHPEARARAELFHRWRPHVLTDHHEMGTGKTFFFQPGEPKRNNPSTSRRLLEATKKFTRHHAAALGRQQILYYSEEGYDDFYPGKGSTYPDLHGCIGILFEQASARGHAQESENGVLEFPFAIRNQVIASLSSLEAALAMRGELREMQAAFASETAALAAASPVKAYVFGDDNDPARAAAFVDLLMRHRIEVRPLRAPLQGQGMTFVPDKAWVVDVAQPQHRLITEIFTDRTSFEEDIFYDVSAWSMPRAYNLPVMTLDSRPPAADPLAAVPSPAGRLVGGHADYAYLVDWRGLHAPRALARLLKQGVVVKVLTGKPIVVAAGGGNTDLPPGTLLIPLGLQPGKVKVIREHVDRMVAEDGLKVYGCDGGLTPAGVDLGSPTFVRLDESRAALITGTGVDAQEIGAVWHTLDQKFAVVPTLLPGSDLGRVNLGRYEFIFMADGSYERLVDDAGVAALKAWVTRGGTLMLTGRALTWAAKREVAPLEFVSEEPTPAGTTVRQPYGTGLDREALKLVAGSIFSVSIDATHPLGFGYGEGGLSLCRSNTLVLKPVKSPYEMPAVYHAQPLRSGYASEENQKRIASSPAAVALTQAKGVVVAMSDLPVFRGFWRGGERVLANAVFFGRSIVPIRNRDPGEEAHAH